MILPSSRIFGLGLLCVALAGCTTWPFAGPKPTPVLVPKAPQLETPNVYAPPQSKVAQRVAMLPIYVTESIGDARNDINEIFRGELSKQLSFEVVPISSAELATIIHREQISSAAAIPPEALRAIREKYAVDALLFTDFTEYRPYRPIAIGVRCKLVNINTLDTLWASDNVFDSADPTVAEAAMIWSGNGRKSSQFLRSEVVLQSPRRFAAFVAHQVFSTLPPP